MEYSRVYIMLDNDRTSTHPIAPELGQGFLGCVKKAASVAEFAVALNLRK